jgi:hypothetical protein
MYFLFAQYGNCRFGLQRNQAPLILGMKAHIPETVLRISQFVQRDNTSVPEKQTIPPFRNLNSCHGRPTISVPSSQFLPLSRAVDVCLSEELYYRLRGAAWEQLGTILENMWDEAPSKELTDEIMAVPFPGL